MSPQWRAAREALLVRLQRGRPSERAEAAALLCEIASGVTASDWPTFGADVAQLMGDQQPAVRRAGVSLATIVLPEPEAQELLRRFSLDTDAGVRVEAVGRLADMAEPSLRGALAQALEDGSFSVRFEAARGMAALKHSAGLKTLCDGLRNADFRFRAAAALAQLGNAEAVPALRDVFHSWFLPAFDRTQIAGALARFGDADGSAYLLKRTLTRWSVDRAMAVELLGEVKAPGALARLLAVVHDVNDACRGAAARGLGSLGDGSAVQPLLRLLAEGGMKDDVRLDVIEGLLRLKAANVREVAGQVRWLQPESHAELQEMLEAYP
jgi:HEAT repeat protein